MGKKNDNGAGKALLIFAGILAILSVLLYYFDEALGAWWQVTLDHPINFFDGSEYTNSFGQIKGANDEYTQPLGAIGWLVGVLVLVGGIVMFYSVGKESKGISLLGWLAVLGGIALFLYGLNNVEDYENILAGLDFITGDEYNVYFGTIDLGIFGNWSWGLTVGCYMAITAVVLGVVGTTQI